MAIDYSGRQFPSTLRTFSIYRLNNTPIGATKPVSPTSVPPAITGLSILLRDMQDNIVIGKDGNNLYLGVFTGNTFPDVEIYEGDILQDETQVDRNGNLIEYKVESVIPYPICLKMHIKRTHI
jgi:hypothetical protein